MNTNSKNTGQKKGDTNGNNLQFISLIECRLDAAICELRRHVSYWAVFVSAIVAVSGYFGFPQLKHAILNEVTNTFMQKEIVTRLSGLQHEIDVYSNLYAKARSDLQLVQLQTDAESGSVNAYNELREGAKSSDFAKQLYQIVTARQLALLSNYSRHYCINELGFGYTHREDWTEDQMFKIICDDKSENNDFNDAMKNLADRHENGEYLDFFVWYVGWTKDLNRLRIAVDCIRYVTSAPKSISSMEISNWWQINKKPEWCHGIDAMKDAAQKSNKMAK